MGFPGDSDPAHEEPEWECSKCGGVVIRDGKKSSKCLDCDETFEADGQPDDH